MITFTKKGNLSALGFDFPRKDNTMACAVRLTDADLAVIHDHIVKQCPESDGLTLYFSLAEVAVPVKTGKRAGQTVKCHRVGFGPNRPQVAVKPPSEGGKDGNQPF